MIYAGISRKFNLLYLKWRLIFSILRRCFLFSIYDKTITGLDYIYIWVIRRVSYKKQELLTLREHTSSPPVFAVRISHLFSFRPVSCIPNVAHAIVSGLSILDCPFGFFLTFILSSIAYDMGFSRKFKFKLKTRWEINKVSDCSVLQASAFMNYISYLCDLSELLMAPSANTIFKRAITL